ncbi:hypothetical protein C8Q80DRAFT_391217 [Daedaleopsis nitida]|nr:hypothetical protein C8Q80DRAFT_391217 [Daedaleopsis nitida]
MALCRSVYVVLQWNRMSPLWPLYSIWSSVSIGLATVHTTSGHCGPLKDCHLAMGHIMCGVDSRDTPWNVLLTGDMRCDYLLKTDQTYRRLHPCRLQPRMEGSTFRPQGRARLNLRMSLLVVLSMGLSVFVSLSLSPGVSRSSV